MTDNYYKFNHRRRRIIASCNFSPRSKLDFKGIEIRDSSIEEIIRKLQAAKFVAEPGSEVCPINRKPGAKTPKPGLDLEDMI